MMNDELHAALSRYNRVRLQPAFSSLDGPNDWLAEVEARTTQDYLEIRFVEEERHTVRERARRAPREPEAFVAWFEALRDEGPGQHDPLFPWLAESATLPETKWFLAQEVAGEAGFEDLVALTQVQFPRRAKLELARNYWDEMGRGHAGGMHGPMLTHLASSLELPPVPIVTESIALGNLMLALACHRSYAYQSIGALGAIELTAPGRATCVNRGLKRLGVPADVRRYFAVHSTLDVEHSRSWNAEILAPLVAERPEVATAIAEGALLRLNAGARCFERYREELWAERTAAAAE